MAVTMVRARRVALALLTMGTLGACQSAGAIGDVLGSVLGGAGGQGQQVQGSIAGVDTRAQAIGLTQGNGQTVSIGYDQNTRVVYQNQNYQVTALERGDQVIMRVVDRGNGAYYTDSVHVTRSVSVADGTVVGSGTVQSMQGVVRGVDRQNGQFSLDLSGGTIVTVSMPYNARSADVTRFNALRIGDSVRLTGVFVNNSRVELREFY